MEKQESAVQSTEENANKKVKKKKRKKAKTTILVVLILFVVAVVGIYVGGAFYYKDKFFSGTKMNGISCAGKTVDEVKELLQN